MLRQCHLKHLLSVFCLSIVFIIPSLRELTVRGQEKAKQPNSLECRRLSEELASRMGGIPDSEARNPAVHLTMAVIYNSEGCHEDAIRFYKEAIRLDLAFMPAYLGLANTYKLLGRHDDAIRTYTETARIDPKDTMALKALARLYLDLRKYQEAVGAFEQVIGREPRDASAYRSLGNTYNFTGKPQEAIPALKKSLELEPDNAYALNELAWAYTNVKPPQYGEAVKSVRHALRVAPRNAYAHAQLSLILVKLNEREEALQKARKAISLSLSSNDEVAARNAGRTLMELGRYEEAIDAFKKTIELNPAKENVYLDLAQAYYILGRYQDAIATDDRIIARSPNYSNAYVERGWAKLYAGRGQDAAEDAQTYLSREGWKGSRSAFTALLGYFSYRLAGQEARANSLLADAAANIDPLSWPAKIYRYLRREVSAEQLLKDATDKDKQTEAHAYIGVSLARSGRAEESLPHLIWVRDNGNQLFVEYPLAVSELKRLQARSRNK